MQTLVTTLTILLFTGLIYQPQRVVDKEQSTNPYKICPVGLRDGDIVLRNGKGFISDMFRRTSQHRQEFSHTGIIKITTDGIMVMHVLSGNDKSGLIIEPIDQFCNGNTNKSYAVYRYSFLEGKNDMIHKFMDNLHPERIVFDEQFELGSDTKLYCTELVYKMCREVAGFDLPQTVSSGEKYIAIDDIYRIGEAHLLFKHTY